MTDIWIVKMAEYEGNGAVAAFTTRDLAEGHAAQLNAVSKGARYEVDALDLLDRLPELVALHSWQGVLRISDGALLNVHTRSSETWDYGLQEPVNVQSNGLTASVYVWDRDPVEAERIGRRELDAYRRPA